MLALTLYHTPEGIAEVESQLLDTTRTRLKDKPWTFITSASVPDFHATATIGAITHNLPEIVFGFGFTTPQVTDKWELAVNRLYTYITMYGMPEPGKQIDACQFYNFFADENTPPIYDVKDLPPAMREIRLIKLDPGHWYIGEGWQHSIHYSADERDRGEIWQWYVPDDQGRYGEDPNYSGLHQVLFETEPFGKREPNEQTAQRIAVNRYMH